MAGTMRKTTWRASASSNGDRRLPAEAYHYDDEVTPAAVDTLRKRAAAAMANDEWEVVDGFGLAVPG